MSPIDPSTREAPPARSARGRARGTSGPWVLALLSLLLVQGYCLYTPSLGGPALFPGIDKVVHAAIFGAPVLAVGAWGGPARWVAAAQLVHAPVSEVVQASWISGRSGDPADALADVVGVALALGVLLWLRWRSPPATPTRRSAEGPRPRRW